MAAAPSDSAFDFACADGMRQSYIVASTPRSGSALFCGQLWKTGVLGAPFEYLSYPGGQLGGEMAKRLAPASHADYLAKVVACRTSKNGVFGLKVNLKDFQETLIRAPETLSLLSPTTHIYFDRRDRLAQAVDMARSLASDRQLSVREQRAPPLLYDRNLISKCLGSLERGRLGWMRWYEANAIVPVVVTYEDLAVDGPGVVRRIVKLLGVQADEPETVDHPTEVAKPSSGLNVNWASRFRREIRAGIRLIDA
jgi:trehalose 2-sulfotransferase